MYYICVYEYYNKDSKSLKHIKVIYGMEDKNYEDN